MRQLNLKHLKYFYQVARGGSIAEASRKLGTSPSTISEQLRLLEASLNASLFHRGGQGLQITESGQVLLHHAEQIFESVDRVIGHFHPDSADQPITLRVGHASSLARSQTAADLIPLLQMPRVRVRVETGDSDALLRSLREGELDLVISERAAPHDPQQELQSEQLPGSPLVVVVGPAHAELAHRGFAGLRELPSPQCMVTSQYRWDVEQWLRSVALEPRMLGEVDDVSLLIAAARSNLCFVVVPQACLVDAGVGLQVVGRLEPEVRTERHAAYRSGGQQELVERAMNALRQAHEGFGNSERKRSESTN